MKPIVDAYYVSMRDIKRGDGVSLKTYLGHPALELVLTCCSVISSLFISRMVDLYNMYADAEAALLLQFKISRTSNPNGNLITWNDPKLMCSNWEILTCSESGNVQVL